MPRPPRLVPPGALVDITTGTTGGLALLHPDLGPRILGIVGRALALYPLSLHGFAFRADHWRALATVGDGRQLAAFLRHVNGNLARAVNEITGWSGPVWARRARVAVVADGGERQLRAIVGAGIDDRGVSSIDALASGQLVIGVWHDREREQRLRRRGPAPRAAVLRPYPVPLAPLPAWSAWTDDQRRAVVRGWLADRAPEAETAPTAAVPAVAGGDLLWHARGDSRVAGASSTPPQPARLEDLAWHQTSR